MIAWTIPKFQCRDYSNRKLLALHFVINILDEPWNLPQTTSKQMQDIS